MTKILYIAYYFPPYQLTDSFRVSRVARFLPDNDIIPIVLTAFEGKHHWHEDILKELDARIKIHRVNNPISYQRKNNVNLYRKDSKLVKIKNRTLMFMKDMILSPDSYLLWAIKIIPRAVKLIRKHQIKHVMICLGPYSPALTGYFLKKITGVTYSLDYRDEWRSMLKPDQISFHREIKPETSTRKLLNTFWEKRCVNTASCVFSVSQTMTNYFIKEYPKQKNCFPVHNGYVESDYQDVTISQNSLDKNKDIIAFYYVGKISVNSDSYNPIKMIAGFKKFLVSSSKKVELHIFGDVDQETKEKIKKFNIEDNILYHGRIERSQLLPQLINADVLVHFYYPDLHPEALSIKIFEYAFLCKPIVSFSNKEGEMANFIEYTESGYTCWGNNEDEIADLFSKILDFPISNLFTSQRAKRLAEFDFEKGVAFMADKIKSIIALQGER